MENNPPFSVGPIRIIHCRSGSPAYPTALNVAFVVEASPATKKPTCFCKKKQKRTFSAHIKMGYTTGKPLKTGNFYAKIWTSGATHWI
jgi:hypothetical protein